MRRTPSVSAPGRAAGSSGGLDLVQLPGRARQVRHQPGRAATPRADFLPHRNQDHIRRFSTTAPGSAITRSRSLRGKAKALKKPFRTGDCRLTRSPSDTADHRLVPFLEIDFWFPREFRPSGAEFVRDRPSCFTAEDLCRSRRRRTTKPESLDVVEDMTLRPALASSRAMSPACRRTRPPGRA